MGFTRDIRAAAALALSGIALMVGLGVPAAHVALADPSKATVLDGRILSGTKAYARLRGTVHLVLTATGGPAFSQLYHTNEYSFILAVRSKCSRNAPQHCVALVGRLRGTALMYQGPTNRGSAYELDVLHGRIAPLGSITLAVAALEAPPRPGTHGRILLPFLLIQTKAGRIVISAHSRIVPDFTTPFHP